MHTHTAREMPNSTSIWEDVTVPHSSRWPQIDSFAAWKRDHPVGSVTVLHPPDTAAVFGSEAAGVLLHVRGTHAQSSRVEPVVEPVAFPGGRSNSR